MKKRTQKRAAIAAFVVVIGIALGMCRTATSDSTYDFQWFGPYASDSLNGAAQYTTDAVRVGGAVAVYFFVRDTLPGAYYSDSLTTAFVQVSNDNSNWMTIAVPAASAITQHDTSSCMVAGDLSNVSLASANNGGWRVCSLAGNNNDTDASPRAFPLIPVEYARFRGVNIDRKASPDVTGDADLVGLRVRVLVMFPKGGGRTKIATP
jgi:hypothetical protein